MSCPNIPYEVLELIFQHLPKASLLQCTTVCKIWNAPATKFVYENVEISRKLLLNFKNQQEEEGNNVGKIVRRLTVNSAYRISLDQNEFLDLLPYIPLVKVIDISNALYYQHQYFTYLASRNKDSVKYLQELIVDTLHITALHMRQYFLIAYSFRNSLQNLVLHHLDIHYDIGSQLNKSAVYFLNDFANLTRLSIDNQNGHSNSRLSLFDVLQSCPNLTDLEFNSKHLIPQESQLLPSSNQTTSAEYKLKKLQNFTLQLPNITEPRIQQVLSHLLINRLYRFNLHLNDEHTGILIKKKAHGYTREEYVLGLTTPPSIDTVSKYFPMDNSCTIKDKHQPIYYHVCIIISDNLSEPNTTPVNTKPEIKKNSLYLYVSYNFAYTDLQTLLLGEQKYPLIESFVPKFTYGNEISVDARVLSSMEVTLERFNYLVNNELVQLLQLAIRTCPKLKFILFSTRRHHYRNNFNCWIGSDLPNIFDWKWDTNIHYRKIDLDSFYNKVPIIIDDPNSLMTTTERFEYMVFTNSIIQTALLKSLVDPLPHIKDLKLINCDLQPDACFNSTLDIRGIMGLNRLSFDIRFVGKDRRHIFIKVELSNDRVSCFKANSSSLPNCPVFEPTTVKYMYGYNRFYSTKSSTIIIKCQELSEIEVNNRGKVVSIIYPESNSVAS